MKPESKKNWRQMAEAIEQRRVMFGMKTQQALADRAQVGIQTIRDLEAGKPKDYRPAIWIAVDLALEWEPGTIRRIVQGSEETQFDLIESLERRVRALEAAITDQSADPPK